MPSPARGATATPRRCGRRPFAPALGVGKHLGRFRRQSLIEKPDAPGRENLSGPLHIVAAPGQLLLDDVGIDPSKRRPRPDVEADAGGLDVAEVHARLIHSLCFRYGAAEIAQPVQTRGNLIAGDVHFPLIAGPFQQTNGLAAFLDAVLEARTRIENDAVKVKRLPLAPEIAELLADFERLLGINDAATEVKPSSSREHVSE